MGCFRLLAFALVAVCGAGAEPDVVLRERVQKRAPQILDLLKRRLAVESGNGLLKPRAELTAEQRQLVEEENSDRDAVFALVAGRSHVPVEDVRRMFFDRAKRRKLPIQEPAGCGLQPAKPNDVARLIQYLKQGRNYAEQRRFDMALAEFQAALAIDPNFLGLQLDVGGALLGLRKYGEAETALKAELRLADCLGKLPDAQLEAFAYFLEVAKPAATVENAKGQRLRTLVPRARGFANYNLACLYAVQQQREPALAALRAAVEAGFSDWRAMKADPELANLRETAEFKQLAARSK